MTWTTIVESVGTEAHLTAGPEGEEEVESSEGDLETPSEIGEADQPLSYIIQFANAVEIYQKKNQNCFRCSSPDHLVTDCPKDLDRIARKASLNAKEGMTKKGGRTPQKPVATQLAFPDKVPRA